MPRRRTRKKCCCREGTDPKCGTCDTFSYGCCLTEVPLQGYYNQTTGQNESGIFKCMRVTIIPTANEAGRAVSGYSPGSNIRGMSGTPGLISAYIPLGPNPDASNIGSIGSGSQYDACTGTAYIFEPWDGIPATASRNGLFGEYMGWGGGGVVENYEYACPQRCGGVACPCGPNSPCDVDCGLYAPNDPCLCDDPLGINCGDNVTGDCWGMYTCIEKRGVYPATGAAISASLVGCQLRIRAFVEYGTGFGDSGYMGTGVVFRYHMEAMGYFAAPQPPDCASPINSEEAYGRCLNEMTFYGLGSPLANAGIISECGGPCGYCVDNETYNGDCITCNCTNGWAINGPDLDYSACPDPRILECSSKNEYGTLICNGCDYPIGGGDFSAFVS